MGKLTFERRVHFRYTPDFVAHYDAQSIEFKLFCESKGRPFGYSGMNVFMVFFVQYWSHVEAERPRIPFLSEL